MWSQQSTILRQHLLLLMLTYSKWKPCRISMLESDRNGSMRERERGGRIALFHFFPFLLFLSFSLSVFPQIGSCKTERKRRRQRREQRVPASRLRTLKGGEFHSIALIAVPPPPPPRGALQSGPGVVEGGSFISHRRRLYYTT